MKGYVCRLVEHRSFGFIRGRDGVEYFFHRDDFNGFFDDLVADIKADIRIEVAFTIVPSQKGPRANEVTRVDNG